MIPLWGLAPVLAAGPVPPAANQILDENSDPILDENNQPIIEES